MFPSNYAPKTFQLSQHGNPNYYSPHDYPPIATNDGQTCELDFEDNNQLLIDQYWPPYSPPSLLHASSKTPQYDHWRWSNEQNPQVLHEMTTTLDHTPSFSTQGQYPVIQETITTGSSSKGSHNNFHIDEGMRERVHAKSKFALRMKSTLEVIDDGYRWIKYGKKKVKSSPYPRNYFKCSTVGCNVKKRIERDMNDSSYVITTYDGVHNH